MSGSNGLADGRAPLVKAALERYQCDSDLRVIRNVFTVWGCPMSFESDRRQRRKPERDLVLSAILKALRAHCGMTSMQIADAMAMDLRSYQRFEAGEGYLKVERIFRFAAVTDSDPYALLASFRLGTPELAVACADNKFVMLLMEHVRELYDRKGQDVRWLQPHAVVEILEAAFSRLGEEVEAARAFSRKWLEGKDDPNTDGE